MRSTLDKGRDPFVDIAEKEFSNNIPSFILQSCSAFLLRLKVNVYPKTVHFQTIPFFCVGLQAAYIHPPSYRYYDSRIWSSQDFTLYLLEYTSFEPNHM